MNAIADNRCSLSDFDWRIVELARRDGPRSLEPDSRWARAVRSVFGTPITRRLANERLERLRCFCVRAWHWDRLSAEHVRRLVEVGYSIADVARILAHVARRRGFTPPVREDAI